MAEKATTDYPEPPIRIRCEGSGMVGHRVKGRLDEPDDESMCPMCGRFPGGPYHRLPEHDRDDIIAMIKRGDFGRPL